MSLLTPTEITPDTGKAPLADDYLSNLGIGRLGLEPEEVPPGTPPATPPGLPTGAPPETPPVQPVPETPADVINEVKSRPEAAKRVEEKNYKKRVEELEA